jgi:hypothetical protein
MGGDREATRRAIQHWRKLREWVTDLRARRALRELIRSGEAELTEENDQEPLDRKRKP